MIYYRIAMYLFGVMLFSLGISITIKMQHLGIHPWDVLNVGMFDHFGLSIGTWNIIIGFLLIIVCFFLDRSYVRVGTFSNAILIGLFVDFYLWLDILPSTTNLGLDIIVMITGIVVMGIGGGMYNAAGLGFGPRDGFMTAMAERMKVSISRMRIYIELLVLVIGFLIGGPVFIFTLIFTFVQSPIFQFSLRRLTRVMETVEVKHGRRKVSYD